MKKIDNLFNNKESYFLLAETAFSHEGNIKYLISQIEEAKKAKVDGIKFQILLNIDDSYSKTLNNYKILNDYRFTKNQWKRILNKVKEETDLEIILLPIDNESVEFCLENQDLISAVEVHSINFNQKPLLEKIAKLKCPIILGAGGRSFEDIDYSLSILEKEKVIIMHGFQAFPTSIEDINLLRINTFKKRYHTTIGYADHTHYNDNKEMSNLINYAYILGARIFEKHIVLKKGEPRVDYESAITSSEFLTLRSNLEYLRKILGSPFKFSKKEIEYKKREKSIVAIKEILKGEIITEENTGFRVTNEISDLDQRDYEIILGKNINRTIEPNQVILKKYISEFDWK